MVIKPSGRIMFVSPSQREKACSAIPRVPSFKVIVVLSGIVPLYPYATLPKYIVS